MDRIIYVSSILFVIMLGCNRTEENENKLEFQDLKKELVECREEKSDLEYQVDSLQRSYDIEGIENMSLELVDLDIMDKIPENIKNILIKNYPHYYIPKKERAIRLGFNLQENSEHPFFIKGEFNDDGIIDYGFYLESYNFDFPRCWSYNQKMVVIYSQSGEKQKDKLFKVLEKNFESGVGIHRTINSYLAKLLPNKKYKFRSQKSLVTNKETILVVTLDNEVGFILEWDGSLFIRKNLWDTI